MWIFIRQINPATTHQSICRFAKKGLKKRLVFFPSPAQGRIKRCGILRIVDRENKSMECHGLVNIEPVASALSAIELLDGTRFRGRQVAVHRYFPRTTERDRRDLFKYHTRPEHTERRRSDRRRSSIESHLDYGP